METIEKDILLRDLKTMGLVRTERVPGYKAKKPHEMSCDPHDNYEINIPGVE